MNPNSVIRGSMELLLGSNHESIKQVVHEAESFLANRIGDEDLAYRVVLLATEAVTNAIKHGNKFDPNKHVRFRIEVEAQRIEITVEDEGTGFNARANADPLACENLLEEGGRGILFMESMADDMWFEEGGRKVRLIFHMG